MSNEFKQPQKKLTRSEIAIGAFSFIVGGIGFIYICLAVWNFIVNVVG